VGHSGCSLILEEDQALKLLFVPTAMGGTPSSQCNRGHPSHFAQFGDWFINFWISCPKLKDNFAESREGPLTFRVVPSKITDKAEENSISTR